MWDDTADEKRTLDSRHQLPWPTQIALAVDVSK